ncbi:hypothetical protein PG985_014906 [Apiospora marii]|uniref:Ankyrin n=1 Tax=Apiospora marii TaxID=335849 RepID=A0ABR1RIX8_9PEZI
MHELSDIYEGQSGANNIDLLIRADDTAGVQAYLQSHPDISRWILTRHDGQEDAEPITLSAQVGSLEVLRLLMTATGNTDWAKPMRIACGNGQVEVARWILDNSEDAVTEHLKDDGSHGSLLLQSMNYHPPWDWTMREPPIPGHIRFPRQEEIVHLLLDRGASVHDKYFTDPRACEEAMNDDREKLNPAEAAEDQWGGSSADWAWEGPDLPALERSHRDTQFTAAETFTDLDDPWIYSSSGSPARHRELKKPVLLETALTKALSFGSARLISRLIDDGCGIHTKVCVSQDINLYEEQTEDVTPLHLACHYRNIAGVRLLLQAGKSDIISMVKARDSCGMTPLHWTTLDPLERYTAQNPGFVWEERHMSPSEKIKACMELLLACDPNLLDATDRWGRTVLHYASMLDSGDAAEFLLEKGADPNIKGDDARTPLVGRFITAPLGKSRAYRQQHPALVTPATLNLESFLRHGARLDETNANGDTLLHIACRSWTRRDVVRWLLAHNVRAGIVNKKNQLPLHIAAKCLNAWDDGFDGLNEAFRAQDDMIRMLKEAGAGDSDMALPDAGGITPAYSLEAGRKKANNIFAVDSLSRAKRACEEVEKDQFKLGYERLPAPVREITQQNMWTDDTIQSYIDKGHVSIGSGYANMLRGTGKVLGCPPHPPYRVPRPRGRSLEQGGSLYI